MILPAPTRARTAFVAAEVGATRLSACALPTGAMARQLSRATTWDFAALETDYNLGVYGGKEKLMVDGLRCCPIDDFLFQLKPNYWPNGVNHAKIRA